MHLLLIRHGESGANISGELDTRAPGRSLTPRGQQQAHEAARALGPWGAKLVASSSMPRAEATASVLAAAWDVPHIVVPGLEEIDAGQREGSTLPEDHAGYLEVVREWTVGELDTCMPGADDGRRFLARYEAAIGAVVAAGAKRAAVVSHGSAIRAWVAQRAQVTAEAVASRLRNTGYVELVTEADQWRLLTWHGDPAGGTESAPDSDDPTAGVPINVG